MARNVKVLWIALVLALLLPACLRPASTPPAMTATPEDLIPFPITITTQLSQAELDQTATALAQPTIAISTETPKPENTATPEEVVIPPLVVPESYTLEKGEFPFCIARRFDLDPAALLNLNGLSTNSVTQPGMTLKIPQGTAWGSAFGARSLRSHPTSYTVTGGETIHTIACSFGDVDPNAIIAVNGLEEPYTLSSGQVLQIP
ncbi:MAG: LysM peptidoglycan-binding domain-containing protein [Anaerolineae bacterium]|nr:LysM peptidoglycan-binding domain-containing protein [Anaerolineae bacterium]